jgi:hypothetical protein
MWTTRTIPRPLRTYCTTCTGFSLIQGCVAGCLRREARAALGVPFWLQAFELWMISLHVPCVTHPHPDASHHQDFLSMEDSPVECMFFLTKGVAEMYFVRAGTTLTASEDTWSTYSPKT